MVVSPRAPTGVVLVLACDLARLAAGADGLVEVEPQDLWPSPPPHAFLISTRLECCPLALAYAVGQWLVRTFVEPPTSMPPGVSRLYRAPRGPEVTPGVIRFVTSAGRRSPPLSFQTSISSPCS